MMKLPARRSLSGRINMTPMIDVTFLLIIFFLLSSRLSQQEAAELDLPVAASSQRAANDSRPRVSVNVFADGRVLVGDLETRLGEITDRLRIERDRSDDDLEVRIRADRGVPYSAVTPVLLACTEANIWNVTFAVFERVEGANP
jgi:biopolymer transport protein ExbD